MPAVSLPCQAPSDAAAAALPDDAYERERHYRTGDRDKRRAASVGEATPLAGEADAEADDRKQRARREPGPGDRARDRADTEANRQTNQREEAEEAERDQRADHQPLRDARGGRRQLLLLGAEVEGEKDRKQREAARVHNR